jgi:hypothetical protein
MKQKRYPIITICCGDTYLDVYGEIDHDEPSVGHVGGIDIEDICIADTDTSVLEMIHSLNWDKFNDLVQGEYQCKDHA